MSELPVIKRIKIFGRLILVLLLLGAFSNNYSQISPGDLSKVHSHLEGLSNCTKCHILGKKVSDQKCLECHTEIKVRIDNKKGFHASTEVKSKECVNCHSDHHGVNFQIIRFSKEKFNHSVTGFPLTGKHLNKQCQDCHKPSKINDSKIKKKSFTYLGLSQNCVPCHADYHQKTLSANCLDCHTTDAFKPASKFDHSRAAFKLIGKHQEVPCLSCHKTGIQNNQKYQEFKGLRFDNCVRCHKDVHNNKFGQNCTQCHSEQSFAVIKSTQDFDHNKTDFKLEGKHQRVACTSCHKTKLTNALKFAKCTDCHSDYHKNQLTRNGIQPDCSQCHTVNGFKEFTYTIEQHKANAFPLKGAHLATPCLFCHLKPVNKADTAWRFIEIGKQCIDCHKNIHQGILSEKYYPDNTCENCHNESKWSSVSFDHHKTNFELTGAHLQVSCRNCHFNKEKQGFTHQKFNSLATSCESCHPDQHEKQFEYQRVTDCNRCHNTNSFKPASKFDHSKTLFPLDGKHINVACIKCHKLKVENNVSFVLYKIKDFKCENCHH